MKAVVHDRYGPPEVLRLADVDPPEPKDDEVLLRVHATTVNRPVAPLRRRPLRRQPRRTGGTEAADPRHQARRRGRRDYRIRRGPSSPRRSGLDRQRRRVRRPPPSSSCGRRTVRRRSRRASPWRRPLYSTGWSRALAMLSLGLGPGHRILVPALGINEQAVRLRQVLRGRDHGGVQHDEHRRRAVSSAPAR